MKHKLIACYLLLLRILAKIQLGKNKPLVVGITGSAGKSSCTRTLANVLQKHFALKYTKKGNSETGIPMEILNIPVRNYSLGGWFFMIFTAIKTLFFDWRRYSIFVVEMGIDSDKPPKNMDTLLEVLTPDIGVLLNANSVHLENFSGKQVVQQIADEKAKMLYALPSNGLAIYNNDQKEFKNLEKKLKTNIQTFGSTTKADLQLLKHQVSLAGSKFKIRFEEQVFEISLEEKLVIEEFFGSIASTLLTCAFLGLNMKEVISELESSYEVLPGRGRVFAGINDSTIIDSSYNSSLEPTTASLKMLELIAKKSHRKIAVLGDMRELGKNAKNDHQLLEKAAIKSADIVITVGPLTNKYFTNKNVVKFLNPYQAVNYLKQNLKKSDLILIKGSQNTILLESVVAEILADKSNTRKLCRQTKYWDKQREQLKKEATLL